MRERGRRAREREEERQREKREKVKDRGEEQEREEKLDRERRKSEREKKCDRERRRGRESWREGKSEKEKKSDRERGESERERERGKRCGRADLFSLFEETTKWRRVAISCHQDSALSPIVTHSCCLLCGCIALWNRNQVVSSITRDRSAAEAAAFNTQQRHPNARLNSRFKSISLVRPHPQTHPDNNNNNVN